jgi:hypothetical protein
MRRGTKSTVARDLVGNTSLIEQVLDQRELGSLEDVVDEQTYRLMVEVYQRLRKDFELSNGQREAINRLRMSIESKRSWGGDMHRNNIFKAAHGLGISLPSSMF